jgi:hypothetical protein
MDYSIRKVRQILEDCANTVYEVDTRTLLAKEPIQMFNIWETEELERAVAVIAERSDGKELVVTTECNWFDEGGTHQALVFASSKASKRVWNKIDAIADSGKSYFIQAEYLSDLTRFPEDYVVFYNGAV